MSSIEPGVVIAEKYIVERIVGRGGVGIVAAARHVTLRQLVALKFLRPEIESDAEVIQRFLREAQAAAQIRSEHVARIMDAGRLEDGTVFLVFEYLAGRDLAAVLHEDGPLPIPTAVDYLTQACEAIAEAHALGIVHRDLKPANLFLTHAPDGSPFVKVLDFGLSKFNQSAAATALTADHHVIGSPHFMSPEQMRSSRDADARSDIWALGVVLFGLLTARVPFEGEYLTEVCAAILEGKSLSLHALRPEIPSELEAAVMRCLQLNPDERFQSVTELVDALRPFAPEHGRGRADRIARVVGGAKLSLLANQPEPPRLSALASFDAPTVAKTSGPPLLNAAVHGSSPVSWSLSLEEHVRGRGRRPQSSPTSETAGFPASPSLAPVLSASTRSRSGRGKLSAVAVAIAVSLVGTGAGLAWLGRGAPHVTDGMANPRVVAAAAAANVPVSHPNERAAPTPIATEAASERRVQQNAPAVSSLRVQAPPRRSAGKAPRVSAARAAAGERAPARANADEQLILTLPH